MTDLLIRIKRAVLAGHFRFSTKALDELEECQLDEADVVEAIVTAVAIHKTIRSTSPAGPGQRLHVIIGTNLEGIPIYTKGKLTREAGHDTYYFLVSSKRAI